MKYSRILFVLFVLFCLVIPVFGAERYEIDFEQKNIYEIGMVKGDVVDFIFNNNRHIVQIRELDFEKKLVYLTSYLWADEKKLPYYNTIGNGNVLKLDFEMDDIPDIYVSVNRMTEEGVSLVFVKVNDAQTVSVSDGDFVFQNRVYDLIIILFLLLVVLIIVVLVSKKDNKK